MAKFICEKGDIFVHPAKQASYKYNKPIIENQQVIGSISTTEIKQGLESSLEVSVCPICQSKIYNEYTEPAIATDVLEDMQLVEFKDVPTYIAKGYVELDRKDHVFAKGIIMLKTKANPLLQSMKEQFIATLPEKDYVVETQEKAVCSHGYMSHNNCSDEANKQ